MSPTAPPVLFLLGACVGASGTLLGAGGGFLLPRPRARGPRRRPEGRLIRLLALALLSLGVRLVSAAL